MAKPCGRPTRLIGTTPYPGTLESRGNCKVRGCNRKANVTKTLCTAHHKAKRRVVNKVKDMRNCATKQKDMMDIWNWRVDGHIQAKALKSLRKDAKLTLAEMAKRMGDLDGFRYHQSALSRWENEDDPASKVPFKTLACWLEVLGASLENAHLNQKENLISHLTQVIKDESNGQFELVVGETGTRTLTQSKE